MLKYINPLEIGPKGLKLNFSDAVDIFDTDGGREDKVITRIPADGISFSTRFSKIFLIINWHNEILNLTIDSYQSVDAQNIGTSVPNKTLQITGRNIYAYRAFEALQSSRNTITLNVDGPITTDGYRRAGIIAFKTE